MKKFWIFLIIILILAIAVFAYQKEIAKAPVQDQTQSNTLSIPSPTPTNKNSPTPTPSAIKPTPATHYSSGSEGESGGSAIQVYEVDFTDQGFTPSVSNLNVGDYVFFKNKSATASFVPADTAYAGFGDGQGVAPGKEYKFEFQKAGKWTIVNQSNPVQTTSVIVK